MKNVFSLLLALCIMQGTFAQKQKFTSYSATDPNITIMGRTLVNDEGAVEFDWPGVTISANFTGSSCAIRMDDTKKNFYNVFIDDQPVVVKDVYSDTILELASGLSKGSHRLVITKRTEGNLGIATFKELLLDQSGKLLPPTPPAARRIEFIGNSITCGYGVESETRTEDFKPETENSYKSYAPITARAFNADYHIIAHSGQGVVRNYGYAGQLSEYTMPHRYGQVLDSQKEPLWEFNNWIPDAVVINLGTNDFSTQPHPNEEDFIREYINLIQFIRANYDTIPVFCVVGPMTDEPCYSYVKKVTEINRKDLNDSHVYFIGIPTYLMEESDWGAYHPKYSGQIKMANHVVPVISSVMGWEYNDSK